VSIFLEDPRTPAVALALLLLALTGIALYSRSEWRTLRYILFRRLTGLAELERAGLVASHLEPARWDAGFRSWLERARGDVERAAGPAARAAFEALSAAGPTLAPRVREMAEQAMVHGAIRSSLIRLDGVLVYVLACPGRPEDRRAWRRCETLAEGWTAHATALRRAAMDRPGDGPDGDVAPPLVALIAFLGLDARDGMLLVAIEGDGEHLGPAILDGTAAARGEPAFTYPFALA
jgi:hypothetical protein